MGNGLDNRRFSSVLQRAVETFPYINHGNGQPFTWHSNSQYFSHADMWSTIGPARPLREEGVFERAGRFFRDFITVPPSERDLVDEQLAILQEISDIGDSRFLDLLTRITAYDGRNGTPQVYDPRVIDAANEVILKLRSRPHEGHYVSAHYLNTFAGLITTPQRVMGGFERLIRTGNIANMAPRFVAGALQAVWCGARDIPSEIKGLITAGAYGMYGGRLGRALGNTAVIAVPVLKFGRGLVRVKDGLMKAIPEAHPNGGGGSIGGSKTVPAYGNVVPLHARDAQSSSVSLPSAGARAYAGAQYLVDGNVALKISPEPTVDQSVLAQMSTQTPIAMPVRPQLAPRDLVTMPPLPRYESLWNPTEDRWMTWAEWHNRQVVENYISQNSGISADATVAGGNKSAGRDRIERIGDPDLFEETSSLEELSPKEREILRAKGKVEVVRLDSKRRMVRTAYYFDDKTNKYRIEKKLLGSIPEGVEVFRPEDPFEYFDTGPKKGDTIYETRLVIPPEVKRWIIDRYKVEAKELGVYTMRSVEILESSGLEGTAFDVYFRLIHAHLGGVGFPVVPSGQPVFAVHHQEGPTQPTRKEVMRWIDSNIVGLEGLLKRHNEWSFAASRWPDTVFRGDHEKLRRWNSQQSIWFYPAYPGQYQIFSDEYAIVAIIPESHLLFYPGEPKENRRLPLLPSPIPPQFIVFEGRLKEITDEYGSLDGFLASRRRHPR